MGYGRSNRAMQASRHVKGNRDRQKHRVLRRNFDSCVTPRVPSKGVRRMDTPPSVRREGLVRGDLTRSRVPVKGVSQSFPGKGKGAVAHSGRLGEQHKSFPRRFAKGIQHHKRGRGTVFGQAADTDSDKHKGPRCAQTKSLFHAPRMALGSFLNEGMFADASRELASVSDESPRPLVSEACRAAD